MVRVKQRYILGEIIFATENGNGEVNLNQLTQRRLLENFRRAIHELYGEVGLAKIQPNFLVKFWNVTTRIFILRVGRENLDMANTALIFMTQFACEETATVRDCRVRVMHVGGTLEKVEKRYKSLTEAWLETSQKK